MGFVEPYHLAIDVGTSRVAAATSRLGSSGGMSTAIFPLGRRADTVATVAFVTEDGSLLLGDAAERRGITEPERLVREFKRSIGDDIPFVVAGHAIAPERLYADTVANVVDLVSDREGAQPAGIVLSHPVAWGAHRLGLVRDALAAAGLGAVEFITEPEAAARHYESERPLDDGQAIAVYDLGGGTFDAVVLRRETGGDFRIVGEPAGIENLGGADFDDMVMRHALGTADVDPEDLTVERADTRLALAQLRRECVEAKEALSYDSDVTIPVLLPSGSPSVRLTRAEFEGMIDGDIARTVGALDDALDSAGTAADDLDCILLIGGSSRIPLVTERLSERYDRPLAIDADPKSSIALGAALTGLIRANDRALGVEELVLSPAEEADAASAAAEPRPKIVTNRATERPADARLSNPRLLMLAVGTFFFVVAVVFSTSQAAGLKLDTPMAAIDKAVSALMFRAPNAPTSAPVAAAADEGAPAPAPDPSTSTDDGVDQVVSPRAKASTNDRTSTGSSSPSPTPTTRADQPATSKTSNETTPAVPISSLPTTDPSPSSSDPPSTSSSPSPSPSQSESQSPSPSPSSSESPSPSESPSSSESPSPSDSPSSSESPSPSESPTTDPASDPASDPAADPATDPATDSSSSSSPEATEQ